MQCEISLCKAHGGRWSTSAEQTISLPAYETYNSDKQGLSKNPLITFGLSSKNGCTTTVNTNSHLQQQEGP